MSYGQTQIYRLALRNLGISTDVVSPSSTDRNKAILDSYYNIARDKVLSDYDWNFASKYRILTPVDRNGYPHPKYEYQFDYPNDCLAIREMYIYTDRAAGEEAISFYNMRNSHSEEGSLEGLKTQEYEVLADETGYRRIYTNVEIPVIRYTLVYGSIEAKGFTPNFVMALSWYLAALAAPAVTGARAKMSDCISMYRQMLREAMTTDANESHKNDDYECEWITARD